MTPCSVSRFVIPLLVIVLLLCAESVQSQDGFAPWSNVTCTPKPKESVVRRELSTLTEAEQLRLRLVFKELMARDDVAPGNSCTFFNIAKHHGYFGALCQHETTTCYQKKFLPWHRLYMYEIEQAGQSIDPDFFLPYWDFTKIYAPRTAEVESLLPELYTNKTFYNPSTNQTEPNPLYTGYRVPPVSGLPYKPSSSNSITRTNGTEQDYLNNVRYQICLAFQNDKYDDFSRSIECPHNLMHNFVGGNNRYSMTNQRYTTFDPIFYVYHGMIDRLWAIWEERHPTGDDTSTAMDDNTMFYPWDNTYQYTFKNCKNYETAFGYSYDDLPNTFDFCNNVQPPPGIYAMYAQFTSGLPLSFDSGYAVRVVADVDSLLGTGVPGFLNDSDVLGILAVPHAMGEYDATTKTFKRNRCTSPSCTTWCPRFNKYLTVPSNLESNYSQNFDVTDQIFTETRQLGADFRDLSGGINVAQYKQELEQHGNNNLFIRATPPATLAVGKVKPTLKCQRDASTNTITVKPWTFQTPDVPHWPDCIAQPGDTLIFHYDAPIHSVAPVFGEEFRSCTGTDGAPIRPVCPSDESPPEGDATCTFTIPFVPRDATYYFICTESDHCAVRGMRMRVVVGKGSGSFYDCPKVIDGSVIGNTCPSSNLDIANGEKTVSPPPNESPDSPYSYNYGTGIRYTCDKGYELIGFPVIYCLQNGSWSSPVPSCGKDLNCSASELEIEDGTFTVTPTPPDPNNLPNSYSPGTTVKFECNENFGLKGSKEVACQATGQWSPKIPTCKSAKATPLAILLVVSMLVVSMLLY